MDLTTQPPSEQPAPWPEQTPGMTTRLSIGDFSKMTYLSIKSLRRYHDMGLLVPADVDRSSGYRYYEASQVPVGQVIRRFRDLGMPLEQVKQVIEASDQTQRNEIIVGHLRQMESALQQTQETVTSLRQLLEQPRAPLPIAVEYRSVTATGALAIREPVAFGDLEEWWVAAFSELQGALGATDATRTGPNGALYPNELFEEEIGEVTAFIPIAAAADSGPSAARPGRVHLVEIPGAEYALTVHEGAFADLDQTYGALGTYVAEREIGLRGTIRENYLVTFEHTDDQSAHRTEVCWPVFHTKAE
jgi:DNA-binding transcriptional MerR regulator